jgi:hypothetical protein
VKDNREFSQAQKFRTDMQQAGRFDEFGSIKGAGDRIGKMAVEVSGDGEATTLISMEKFFREHASLRDAIRKHRSLIPASQQAAEVKNEQLRDLKQAGGKTRRGGMMRADEVNQDKDAQRDAGAEGAFPRSPTAFVDLTYGGTEGGAQPLKKLTRKETEEYLKRILENTVNVTKVLEEQLKELQARGWNEYIM